jgi:hypothetical protein
LQLLPVGANNCNEFGWAVGPSRNLLQLLPVGGNNCNEFGWAVAYGVMRAA